MKPHLRAFAKCQGHFKTPKKGESQSLQGRRFAKLAGKGLHEIHMEGAHEAHK